MTQPQQPFGEAGCAYCAPTCTGRCDIADALPSARASVDEVVAFNRAIHACMRNRVLGDPRDARIAALETTVAELRARLDDHLNRQAL